ncbi:hypothetical protein UPYG_G00053710 [Umbra pygmaea]|uniref:Uncharacterized protein n=1 Tax=Umbra pygmaea TaxID=75934 RepID=A0ABD0XSR4_UMBPY
MSSLNPAPVKEVVGWTEKHGSGQHDEKVDMDRAVKRERNAFRIKTETYYEFITVKKEEDVEEKEDIKINAEDFSLKEKKDDLWEPEHKRLRSTIKRCEEANPEEEAVIRIYLNPSLAIESCEEASPEEDAL